MAEQNDGEPMTGIKIERPDEERLKELDISGWHPWECEPSEFLWEYEITETAYVKEGHVFVTPTGGTGGDTPKVEIKPGDLVTFPKGMRCKWDIRERISKVYTMEE